MVVEASFLLFSLNEYLSRTALLVQPLHLPPDTEDKDLVFVDIPLPLPAATEPLIGGIATSKCALKSQSQHVNLWPCMSTTLGAHSNKEECLAEL